MLNNSRHELKFTTFATNYHFVKNWIRTNNLNLYKEYDDRKINNIYFDTINYDSYKSNIYGISSRSKIRYRWYGNFFNKNLGSLEFKIKRNIYGFKERFRVKNLRIDIDTDWSIIKKEIKNSLSIKYQNIFNFNCYPKIINQFDREYFKSRNGKIRVTLDKSIKIYDQRMGVKMPNFFHKTFSQNYIVVEVKFDRGDRNFFDNYSIDLPIKASKNSKYINAIRAVTGI